MKNNKNKMIIQVLIIIFIIMIIIIGVVLISLMKKNDKEMNETDPNGDLIEIVNNSEDSINMSYIDNDSNDVNNSNKVYQEMNWENYYENNKDNKTFRIQDVIHNSDGTITIKGRVYKYLELPSNISSKEYQALLDGKSLNILGEKVTKVQDDNIAKEAGYETALKVETKKYKYNFYYYLNKNTDGTASLYNGSDSSVAEGTNIYLQKTLSGDFECSYYGEKIALKDYYKNDIHIDDVNKTRLLHKNEEFIIDEEDGSFFWLVVTGN